MRHTLTLVCTIAFLLTLWSGCDAGLEPPDDPGTGTLEVVISYPGSWPDEAELDDLRFVGMRFVPTDTTDFFRLNDMIISNGLDRFVSNQTITLLEVPTGTYFYSGVAQKFGPDLLDWRPVGLVTDNGGLFTIGRGERVSVRVDVDFENPPPFPPQ